MKLTAAHLKGAWLAFILILMILVLLSRLHVPLPTSSIRKHFPSRSRGDKQHQQSKPGADPLVEYYGKAVAIVDSLPNERVKLLAPANDGGRKRAIPKALKGLVVENDDDKFQLNEAAEKYPSLADYLGVDEGVYRGMTFKMVSKKKPRAFLVQNVLTDEEAAELINIANRSMARSEVVHAPGTSGVNSVRTSYGMFIGGSDERHPANVKLRQQAADFVGISVANVEATQILRYYPGQYYRAHPDYFAAGSEHLQRGGQRFATMLCWLNDPGADGASTKFPMANIELRPMKNGAVIFYSMDHNGEVDSYSTHEAVPPKEGHIKWVAVNWIRQHEFH